MQSARRNLRRRGWQGEADPAAGPSAQARDIATGGGSCAFRSCHKVSRATLRQDGRGIEGGMHQPFLRDVALVKLVVEFAQLGLQFRIGVGHGYKGKCFGRRRLRLVGIEVAHHDMSGRTGTHASVGARTAGGRVDCGQRQRRTRKGRQGIHSRTMQTGPANDEWQAEQSKTRGLHGAIRRQVQVQVKSSPGPSPVHLCGMTQRLAASSSGLAMSHVPCRWTVMPRLCDAQPTNGRASMSRRDTMDGMAYKYSYPARET